MRTRPVTVRQREVLDWIVADYRKHGTPATLREVGRALGIGSTNGVADTLKALVRKGMLRVARQNGDLRPGGGHVRAYVPTLDATGGRCPTCGREWDAKVTP